MRTEEKETKKPVPRAPGGYRTPGELAAAKKEFSEDFAKGKAEWEAKHGPNERPKVF